MKEKNIMQMQDILERLSLSKSYLIMVAKNWCSEVDFKHFYVSKSRMLVRY